MKNRIAVDHKFLESRGIVLMHAAPGMVVLDEATRIALDAQPELVTAPNVGIPAYLSNYMDPKFIEILQAPIKATEATGHADGKKGDWLTTVTTFPVIEHTGETSAYGDYNNNGGVNVNANFPQRQSFHYQTITQYGEKELANASLAKIDWANQLNIASAKILNKYQNLTYLFGVAGLANYGLLNDPSLSAPIAPTVSWATATPAQIYGDIVRLFALLQTQANGLVDTLTPMTLVMSPTQAVYLNGTNQYNVNVYDQIKKNYPNITVVTVPEYNTTGGQLVQMIATELDGQVTVDTAFTEKMRAHAIVVDLSSFKQKKSQGTWGTIWYRPFLCAQMLG